MVFTLSTDPVIQEMQLKELLERSQRMLALLTSPVIILDVREGWSREVAMYGKDKTCQDYQPPMTRFAKLNYRYPTDDNN